MSRSWSTVAQGNTDRDLCTLAGRALYLYPAAQSLDPLAHRREPHAGPGRGGIELRAVVAHPRQHCLALHPQPYFDVPRSRMAPGVGDGLLQDTQKLHAHLSWELFREPLIDR